MRSRAGERNEQWLLIKSDDEWARAADEPDLLDEAPLSVATGRSLDEIAAGAGSGANVWQSNRAGAEDAAAAPKPARAKPERRPPAPARKAAARREGRKGRAPEGGAQSPKGAGRSLSVRRSRRRAGAGRVRARSAAAAPASSGPWSRPVSARRSGMNSARPLAPVAALTASVQRLPGRGVPGLRRQQRRRPRRREPRPRSPARPARRRRAHQCRRIGELVEVAAHREPERLAAADAERRSRSRDRVVGQVVDEPAR